MKPGQKWDIASLYVAAGRDSGVRAQDIVGALANEIGLDPRAVGSIEVSGRHSLVEVPAEIADELAEALCQTRIKGKHFAVRRV